MMSSAHLFVFGYALYRPFEFTAKSTPVSFRVSAACVESLTILAMRLFIASKLRLLAAKVSGLIWCIQQSLKVPHNATAQR